MQRLRPTADAGWRWSAGLTTGFDLSKWDFAPEFPLYTTALDLLALRHYADEDRAISLGKLIAKGKESDVYEVLSAKSELFALKFFRLGRSSFRDVKRKRASSTSETHSWVSSNYNASKHEFAALRRLRPFTPNVAEAVDQCP